MGEPRLLPQLFFWEVSRAVKPTPSINTTFHCKHSFQNLLAKIFQMFQVLGAQRVTKEPDS